MKSIGELFKERRKKKGLSQDEIAEKLNVTKSYISMVENEKKKPTIEFLNKAAGILNVDVLDFYDGKIKPTEELTSENLEWVILGEEMKKENITPEQLREWVRIIKATQR